MSGVRSTGVVSLQPASRLRSNSLFGALGFLVPTAVLVASYPPILTGIGADAFGLFLLASSLATVATIAELGIGPATTHLIARDIGGSMRGAAGDKVITCIVFYALAGFAVGISVWVGSAWLAALFHGEVSEEVAEWTFRFGAIQVLMLFLIQPSLAAFKGIQRFDLVAILASILSIASFGCAVGWMTLIRRDLLGVMAGFVSGYGIVAVLSLTLLPIVLQRANVPLRGSRASLGACAQLMRFGLVMTAGSIAGVFLYHLQRFVIGATVGPQGVTIYQLATVIPSKVQTLVATATEALFPYASAAPERGALRHAYLRMLVGGAATASLLLLILVVIREPLFETWVGGEVADSASALLPTLAAAFFFITLSAAPYYLGNGLGKPHLVTALYLVAGILNGILLLAVVRIGLTLEKVAGAFLLANLLTFAGYQILAEVKLWRNT